MNDRLGETPKGAHALSREKIKRMLFLSEEVINRGYASKIMKRIVILINNPAKNEEARLLSLLMAEKAPQMLLNNQKLIKGQAWAKKVLAIAELNLLNGSD